MQCVLTTFLKANLSEPLRRAQRGAGAAKYLSTEHTLCLPSTSARDEGPRERGWHREEAGKGSHRALTRAGPELPLHQQIPRRGCALGHL